MILFRDTLRPTRPGDELALCPSCGRVLAVDHEDGSFDLAAKASVVVGVGRRGFAGTQCLWWLCRLRRKWRETTATDRVGALALALWLLGSALYVVGGLLQ